MGRACSDWSLGIGAVQQPVLLPGPHVLVDTVLSGVFPFLIAPFGPVSVVVCVPLLLLFLHGLPLLPWVHKTRNVSNAALSAGAGARIIAVLMPMVSIMVLADFIPAVV